MEVATLFLHLAPCKGIQASCGFRIPHRGFRIPTVGFRIPCLRIPDSKLSVIPDSKVFNSGFIRFSKVNIFKQESSYALQN